MSLSVFGRRKAIVPDPSGWRWLGTDPGPNRGMTAEQRPGLVETVGTSLFSSDTVALQNGLLFSDVRDDANNAAEGLLALRFSVVDREIGASVDISEAFVSDGSGSIVELAGLRIDEIRVLPTEYAMGRNFPNPFNPETQISFQLPESTELTMIVLVASFSRGHRVLSNNR